VFDRKGAIRHEGGVLPVPGAYLMGMQFLRRRKSALIDGAADDARDLSAHLDAYLAGREAGRAELPPERSIVRQDVFRQAFACRTA
jgi:putative flavoprotein involved in K+ transport